MFLISANGVLLAQPQTFNPPGTRLMLTLPQDFQYDRSLPGFVSTTDSSTIVVSEVSNPYTFDELLGKRLLSLSDQGVVDRFGFRSKAFNGYQGVEFVPASPTPLRKTFALMFGSDDFMADIWLTTTPQRFETLKHMLMEATYDAGIIISEDELLGFSASLEGTRLGVFKKDGNTINSRETDEKGNISAWLNLTRMPAAMYGEVNAEEAIDATYKMYRFEKQFLSSDTEMVDHASLLMKIYSVERSASSEFTMIGIVRREGFYLLVMGGAGSRAGLEELRKVIRTIRFRDPR